ncbi:hypothetical protein [Hamadaea tsunoensis]|uniref:hypothetical protein n=1 Tax=Hamadaea tsunoensis TaxID=53368 RepID=UPI00042A8AA1|nr:hypothetical protein [Hamadaea tsunoensis]
MPEPTLPLPTEPIPPSHGEPHGHLPPQDPYADTMPAYAIGPYAPPPAAPVAPVQPPAPPVQPPAPAAPPPARPSNAIVPAPVPAPGTPPPIVARIGEIAVSSTTIYTPAGEMPLRRSQWLVTDQRQAHTKIPTWAIVLTILTFFCMPLLNFLFLLARETYYTGQSVVSVTSGGRHYVAYIPVANQAQAASLNSQINYVRSLAAL